MTSVMIRPATATDAPTIMAIIQQAKQLLAADGIPQWQGAYPTQADIDRDIDRGYTYLLLADHEPVGTATLFQEPDPNYATIYNGEWQPQSSDHYATIHRIAIAPGHSGSHLGDLFFSNLTSEAYRLGFRELRIDTHANNARMQHVLLKAGFTYSGIVRMDDDPNDLRNVYQLFL